jgi:hypothetical protein
MILHLGSGVLYLRGTTIISRLAVGERDPTAAKSLSRCFYDNDIQNIVVSNKYPSSH